MGEQREHCGQDEIGEVFCEGFVITQDAREYKEGGETSSLLTVDIKLLLDEKAPHHRQEHLDEEQGEGDPKGE